MRFIFRCAVFLVGLILTGCVSPWKTNSIYKPATGRDVSLLDVASELSAGGVVIVAGPPHFEDQNSNRESFLRELAIAGNAPVSVATDEIERFSQSALDQYLAGNLLESEFVRTIEWKGADFVRIRSLLLYPRAFRGWAVALGPNRALVAKIARTGLQSLSENDRSKLPPNFQPEKTSDFDRYRKLLGADVDPLTIQNGFDAQAYANDFKAYIAAEFLKLHPEQRLVLFTDDDFWTAYDGGLVSRFRARGVPVFVLMQVNLKGLGKADEDQIMQPDPIRGPRARYLWIRRD